MAKERSLFFCSDCGGETAKWQGRCPHCGNWNTMVEEKVVKAKVGSRPQRLNNNKALPITQVEASSYQRFSLANNELNNVLGGGLMPGSSLLLAGEPGIGKSTLLLQIAHSLQNQGPILYISGEESAEQIQLRAKRLETLADNIYLLAETNINLALEQAKELKPKLMIIDSIQAVYDDNIQSAAGSISQVRAVTAACLEIARLNNCAVILIGHVTKDGQLAGPKVLEHMVDTVLYFEGDRHNAFRLLRAIKNRFGATNEIGIFEMNSKGLQPLEQPSAYFLAEYQQSLPGSALTCIIQGSRPLLLEVQALVAPSGYGNARRLAAGYDYQRLLMLLAVLERKLALPLANRDVYLNIAGGLKVEDTALDLAAAAAIVSSLKEQPLESGLLIFGEVGLLGELRSVAQSDRRLKEAASLGFKTALSPKEQGKKSALESDIKKLSAPNLPQALAILGLG